MQKLIGTLVTWLLLLAIPMQGQAATAVLFCGAGHHGVLAQASAQPASEHHTAVVATAEPAQDESMGVAAPGNEQAMTTTGAQVGEWTVGHASGDDNCSAYTVLVGTSSSVQLPATVSQPIPYALESFVNYIPKRLAPPPRAIFA
jgi:hypothetical protein